MHKYVKLLKMLKIYHYIHVCSLGNGLNIDISNLFRHDTCLALVLSFGKKQIINEYDKY